MNIDIGPLLDLIPPSWREPLALVGAVLVATTPLVHALLPLARWLERRAAQTPATWDDVAARRLVRTLDTVAWALRGVAAVLPRVTVGRLGNGTTPSSEPPQRRPPEAGAAALALLIFAAALSAAASGCGASQLDAHTRALAVLVETHRTTGEIADDAYQRALDAATTVEEVDAVHARWSPVAHSLDAAREAILAYGAALGAALRDAAGHDWMLTAAAALARAIRAWEAIGAALREADTGIDLPSLPDTVLGLADLAIGLGGDQ